MQMQFDARTVEDFLHDVIMHVTDMKADVVSTGKQSYRYARKYTSERLSSDEDEHVELKGQ